MSQEDKKTTSGLKDALLLTAYSFCLLAGYYQVKPISRTLFIGEAGASNLPYIWLGSALVLLLIIPFLQRCFKKHPPLKVLSASTLSFSILLLGFWASLFESSITSAICFYILIDVYIVVLVENFWSINNIVFEGTEGKKWYGFIASGSILGAIAGSAVASTYLKYSNTDTLDLIFIAIFFFVCSLILAKIGFKDGVWSKSKKTKKIEKIKSLELISKALKTPVLRILIYLLLLSQIIGPIVEYLFLNKVESSFSNLKDRTQYLSNIFTMISSFALATNLLALPFLLKYLGLGFSLVLQPLLILIASFWNLSSGTLLSAASLKIFDRGLSYSIGRSAREVLYLEQNPQLIYFMKSWIDMFGYRMFKILGALIILLASNYLSLGSLPILVLILAFIWILAIFGSKALNN